MMDEKPFRDLFLSVGAMKSGTTWLYTQLNRHRALHFTPEKELHYFFHKYVNPGQLSEKARLKNARDRYLLRFDPEAANIDRVRLNLHWVSAYLSNPVDDHWYRNQFQMRQHEIWACDFSNLSALLPPRAWQNIARDCNRLRVLYTMRHPVERLWSHVKFHLGVTNQIEKLDLWGPDDYRRFIQQPHIWANAEYGAVLQNLNSALPKGTAKVIFYENLHADQVGHLREIETFLEIPHTTYPKDSLERRPAQSVKREMPDFFADLVAKDVSRIVGEVRAAGYIPPPSWPN
jgi:hypothetical protein